MRVFITGATGFIGSKLVLQLVERGDHVIAAVRNPDKARMLVEAGCEARPLRLQDQDRLVEAMNGCDIVYHLAGRVEMGLPSSERNSMMEANVELTRAVLDAASNASVGKLVYASTINVFGDTRGAIIDERYRRLTEQFFSLYDESKFRASEIVTDHIDKGAPITVVHPGVVYGLGDHFEVGRQLLLAATGKLKLLMFGDVGMTMAYVDDVVDGFIAAGDRGRLGEGYILGGEITRLREALALSAVIAGVRFRPLELPTSLLKSITPLGPYLGPKLGYPPNFKELIEISDGRTYWADDSKARRELGYQGRSLEEGLRTLLKAHQII